MTPPSGSLSPLDLVELSDIAWTAADPAGAHEDEERLWVALLPHDWPATTSMDELRNRLAEVVAALETSADPGRLRLVAILMCFAAAHPEHRQLDEGSVQAALEEAFGRQPLPSDIGGVLAQRAAALDAHVRAHAARHPARHARHRPAPELEP
jgi:hypothetical protein